MAKRMIVMLTVTLLFVAALGFVKFKQIQTAIAQGAAFQPPPEAVTTIMAKHEKWPATLNAIGTVAAVQGVTVSADLPGIVGRIAFESGASAREVEERCTTIAGVPIRHVFDLASRAHVFHVSSQDDFHGRSRAVCEPSSSISMAPARRGVTCITSRLRPRVSADYTVIGIRTRAVMRFSPAQC